MIIFASIVTRYCLLRWEASWLHCRHPFVQPFHWVFSRPSFICDIFGSGGIAIRVRNHVVDRVEENNVDGIRYSVNVMGGYFVFTGARCTCRHFRRLEKSIHIPNRYRSIRKNWRIDYLCLQQYRAIVLRRNLSGNHQSPRLHSGYGIHSCEFSYPSSSLMSSDEESFCLLYLVRLLWRKTESFGLDDVNWLEGTT